MCAACQSTNHSHITPQRLTQRHRLCHAREAPIPQPEDGEVLVRSLYLTVDPYMRGRMSDRPSYIPPFPLNAAPAGGVVARVIDSRSAKFKAGDIVLGFLQWTDYAVAKESDLQKLNPKRAPITTALGIWECQE